MGVIEIIISVVILILVVVIFAEPLAVLTGVAETQLAANGALMKQGTDREGNVVDVGYASAFPDITTGLMAAVGFFITLGVIIWVIRFGPKNDQYGPPGGGGYNGL